MKKFSLIIGLLLPAFLWGGIIFSQENNFTDFPQDNSYGDYLISGVRKNISLELEGANLIDVLKMFSQYTGLNFISTEIVKDRTLTLYMEEVPVKDALNIIFRANNLAYDYYPEANIFVVKEMGKPEMELKTKVYRLKYARVKGSKFQSEINSITGGSNEVAIKESVQEVLSEYGKAIEEPATNSLIVTDVPVRFPTIDEVISQLDIPQQKVLIEVEMIDVSKVIIDELGVDFGGSAAGFQTAFDIFAKNTMGAAGKYKFDSLPNPHREGTYTVNFDPLFKAIYTDTTTKILARPKILTLSGETAEIGIISDTVVGTTVQKAQDTAVTISVDPERTDTGVSLRVTPFVNPGTNEISIVLQPKVKETANSGFSDENNNEFYNVEETSTKSVVRLQDGQTLLIGGLIKNKNISVKEELPFFSKLPLIGKFFKNRDKNDQERELLVFLTPHIIKEESGLVKKEEVPYREQKDSSKKKVVAEVLDQFSK